ncbi:MAG TPA: ABC transporter permease [Gemmataceae bacterium]|nr:ABC transporter permease [Gemmataceae bacterium]
MNRVALMMLFNARGKFVALVFGVSFAVLLCTQPVAIFLGVLERATGVMQFMRQADIWVASNEPHQIEMFRGLSEQELERVRSVPGVAWAQPLLSINQASADLPNGRFYRVHLIGIDRATLVGQPPEMLEGNLSDLRLPDTVLLETSNRQRLPGIGVGAVLRLNDRRARVIGICRARGNLLSLPTLYASYATAKKYVPESRRPLSYIMVKVKPDASVAQVRRAIQASPSLQAYGCDEFRWITMSFVMFRTSIGANFAVTVGLGVLVGFIVSLAAFNQFTADYLPHFALLKAVGTRPRTLVRMVLLQALTVGLISYGIGIGMAGVLVLPTLRADASLVAVFPWQLLAGGLAPMLVCVSLGSMLNLPRVLRADPALLFR